MKHHSILILAALSIPMATAFAQDETTDPKVTELVNQIINKTNNDPQVAKLNADTEEAKKKFQAQQADLKINLDNIKKDIEEQKTLIKARQEASGENK